MDNRWRWLKEIYSLKMMNKVTRPKHKTIRSLERLYEDEVDFGK